MIHYAQSKTVTSNGVQQGKQVTLADNATFMKVSVNEVSLSSSTPSVISQGSSKVDAEEPIEIVQFGSKPSNLYSHDKNLKDETLDT